MILESEIKIKNLKRKKKTAIHIRIEFLNYVIKPMQNIKKTDNREKHVKIR